MKDRCLEETGTLQNQTLISYSYLNFDYFHRQDVLPFKMGRVYKVHYKVDDSKTCFWCMTSIEDVSDMPASDLPKAFRGWEIGREQANVAPFNLSESDRKKWHEE